MNTELINKKFEQMGARVKFAGRTGRSVTNQRLSLNIGEDRRGEFFEITNFGIRNEELEVIDLRPKDRHLLLLVREDGDKSKFLCGHDERHWFVAGIPESAPVGTVRQAKAALQPEEVQLAVAKKGLSNRARNRRKNAAFVRQGEWFFLPTDGVGIDDSKVLRNEPLRRSHRGKPHWVDYCYRTGGEFVYVCSRYPNGLIQDQYQKVLKQFKGAKNWGWRSMLRNPGVYVRGRVRHADHATIMLQGWHRVVMNTENESRAMRNVAFLD